MVCIYTAAQCLHTVRPPNWPSMNWTSHSYAKQFEWFNGTPMVGCRTVANAGYSPSLCKSCAAERQWLWPCVYAFRSYLWTRRLWLLAQHAVRPPVMTGWMRAWAISHIRRHRSFRTDASIHLCGCCALIGQPECSGFDDHGTKFAFCSLLIFIYVLIQWSEPGWCARTWN